MTNLICICLLLSTLIAPPCLAEAPRPNIIAIVCDTWVSRTSAVTGAFSGNHAVRDGDWKLVAERSRGWELYDLSQDRSETSDVASRHPNTVEQLAGLYDAWAKRTDAKTHQKC